MRFSLLQLLASGAAMETWGETRTLLHLGFHWYGYVGENLLESLAAWALLLAAFRIIQWALQGEED